MRRGQDRGGDSRGDSAGGTQGAPPRFGAPASRSAAASSGGAAAEEGRRGGPGHRRAARAPRGRSSLAAHGDGGSAEEGAPLAPPDPEASRSTGPQSGRPRPAGGRERGRRGELGTGSVHAGRPEPRRLGRTPPTRAPGGSAASGRRARPAVAETVVEAGAPSRSRLLAVAPRPASTWRQAGPALALRSGARSSPTGLRSARPLDHPAESAAAGVAGRVGLLIVLPLVDHQGGSIGVEH